MRIIEIRPSLKRFKGYWVSYECEGVEPVYRDKQAAIHYACQRFGGSKGEVHIYAADNVTLEQVIPIDGTKNGVSTDVEYLGSTFTIPRSATAGAQP